jgi:hypothetical protein
MGSSGPARVRIERGIYRQPNGKYAVCWCHAGRLHFRTVGFDLADARRERLALIAATREGKVPVSPRLRFETVAGWWLERFEARVVAGERHPRTLEAHRYQQRSTSTHTCSRTPATRKTSGPAWRPARSPACSSPRQPRRAPRCSSSDSGRKHNHERARTLARHPRARSRPLGSSRLPHCSREDAQVNSATRRLSPRPSQEPEVGLVDRALHGKR